MRTHLVLRDEPVSFLSLYLPFHLHNTERLIHPHRTESYSVPYYNSIFPPFSDDSSNIVNTCWQLQLPSPPPPCHFLYRFILRRNPFDLLTLHGWLFVFHNIHYLCGDSHQTMHTFCRIKQIEWCVLLEKSQAILMHHLDYTWHT